MEILLWFNHTIFVVLFFLAFAGYLLAEFLPKIKQIPLKTVFLAAMLLSSFALGMHNQQEKFEHELKIIEHQLLLMTEKANTVNEVVKTKVITKTQVIRETVNANQEIVKQTVGTQLNLTCELPTSSIMLHDSSSQNIVASGPRSVDATPSGIEASKLLETVVENYGACYQNALRLQAWQDWYKEQSEIFAGTK